MAQSRTRENKETLTKQDNLQIEKDSAVFMFFVKVSIYETYAGLVILLPWSSPLLDLSMAGYDDQAEELYYMDDTAGSFDQDLVYALDAVVRHSVNQALAQAIQPIKHHLLG
ncbi:hypothetical protein NDU88_006802 [Pleurodeles waltl]|uniref:Uncharacterized protein n=1 Tax=Pleurodeles waltl TaxID=8319 RepID=A0AAV7M158_PLEWA|nr:hypothetical protein NDU88_006802 [Pleurodeles waltl]